MLNCLTSPSKRKSVRSSVQRRHEGRVIFQLRFSLLLGLLLLSAAASAQTTQGLISGRLANSVSGAPIGGARIVFASSLTTLAGGAVSDSSGYYLLPLLSPGLYQIRVTADGYQAQEVQNIELTVAARIDLDFRLRPLNDVWEAGQYNSVFLPGSKTIVTFYGPDVDSTKTGSFEAQKGRSERWNRPYRKSSTERSWTSFHSRAGTCTRCW